MALQTAVVRALGRDRIVSFDEAAHDDMRRVHLASEPAPTVGFPTAILAVKTRLVVTGERWIDTSEKLVLAQYQRAKASGVDGVVRYLTLPEQNPAIGIDANEMFACLSSGLALMLVQFSRTSGLTPQQGHSDGAFFAARALTLGYPCGAALALAACLWGDFFPSSRAVMMGYGNPWYGGTTDAGAAASAGGGYNEPGVPADLNLYTDYNFHRYWRCAAEVPNVERRGYQMLQLWPGNRLLAPGFVVDYDAPCSDWLGSYPVCAVAA